MILLSLLLSGCRSIEQPSGPAPVLFAGDEARLLQGYDALIEPGRHPQKWWNSGTMWWSIPPETKVFSPIDGRVDTTGGVAKCGEAHPGPGLTIQHDPGVPWMLTLGGVNPILRAGQLVEKGQLVGYVADQELCYQSNFSLTLRTLASDIPIDPMETVFAELPEAEKRRLNRSR